MASRMRASRKRSRGQSLPLIALMIVVLVAMVGLSVDVGNTFQEERQAVSAANAASLAGMNTVIRKSNTTTNRQVYSSIAESLRSNGVMVSEDGVPRNNEVQLEAFYIDSQGKPLGSISANDSRVPNDVSYVQIRLNGLVNTYFAQIVGRPDLPINATSYAGQCALGDGVYPIGVDQNLLDGTKFTRTNDVDPVDGAPDDDWRVIQSGQYKGYTARKIYVHESNTQPGSFGFLRWEADKDPGDSSPKSAGSLEASMTGFGNLAEGFDEAPEALLNNAPADPNYPESPGELTPGDWVYGTEGWKGGGQSDAIFKHIDAGTRMVLPIYDRAVGTGNSQNDPVRFRVSGFGSFVLLDTNGYDGEHGNGGKKFFEMVYLGPATRMMTACQVSQVPPSLGDCCKLWGEVSFLPEYQIIPKTVQPIEYIVVLDQSGSMSANFNGQCDVKRGGGTPPARNFTGQPSAFWQCANGPQYDSNGDGIADTEVLDRVTGTGPDYYWSKQNERRITVAKKALETLIKQTNMPGNPTYNPSYPDDQMGLMWFTHTVDQAGNNEIFANGKPFTNDTAELISKMWARTTLGSDIYRTEGGTNGAAALYRAGLILNNGPKDILHTDGKKYTYKKVVLFITDGVSNQFFHESESDGLVTQSSSGTYPDGHPCKALGSMVIEDARCQTTSYGGVYTPTFKINGSYVGLERPVTQAINVSQKYLHANSYAVFVIALSSLPATGLANGIPSFTSYYHAVPQLETYTDGTTNVDVIVKKISDQVEDDRCQPGRSPITDQIVSGNMDPAQLPDRTVITYPEVGYVLIRSTTSSTSFLARIKADQTTGKMTYLFPKVPPGTYMMSATLYFSHPDEPPGINNRAYQGFWDGIGELPLPTSISVEVTSAVSSGSFVPSTQKNIEMRLNADVCAGT